MKKTADIAENQIQFIRNFAGIGILLLCSVGIVRLLAQAAGLSHSFIPTKGFDRLDHFELWTYVGWAGTILWMYASPATEIDSGNRADTGTMILLDITASMLLTIIGRPNFGILPMFFILSLMLVPLLNDGKPVITAMLLSTIGHATAIIIRGLAHLPIIYISIGGMMIVFTIIARTGIRDWRKQSTLFEQAQWAAEELSRSNTKLRESMNWREINSRSMERIRVAREVHDTVGHTLTTVLFQISAVKAISAEHPEDAAKRLDTIEEMVRSSLQEVRREVSNLRDEAEWRNSSIRRESPG